jgi:hypothetical protein
LTRRALIQISAGAALAGAAAPPEWSEPEPKFFSREQFAVVDILTELIIPADGHSSGARAARVAEYLDARLAEAFEDDLKAKWREGLDCVQTISGEMHGVSFAEATPEQQVALLTRISKNEDHPQAPEEHFFQLLKSSTAHAYYTSKIGLHQELEYKGNVLLQEFVGYELK